MKKLNVIIGLIPFIFSVLKCGRKTLLAWGIDEYQKSMPAVGN